MKITAEFNSNAELVSFISTFGAVPKTEVKNKTPELARKIMVQAVEDEKINAPKVETKKLKQLTLTDAFEKAYKVQETKKATADIAPNPEITKEMVRALFSKLFETGKDKEAIALCAKYGAEKFPDLLSKDYAAIYEEAGGLV